MYFKKNYFTIILSSILFLTVSKTIISKKIVLSGGPCVGKSTIISQLKKLGYCTMPEAFTLLYNQAKEQNSLDKLFNDPILFRYKLMEKQLELESLLKISEGFNFIDRSSHEVIFFGQYYKLNLPQDLIEQSLKRHYDVIFFLDPLPEEFYEFTEIRNNDRTEAIKIHNFLKQEYIKLGYQIIDVPFDTVHNRINFILNTLKLHA